MTGRKYAYLKYLESDHWLLLRERALTRDGRKCTRCGSVEILQVHHKRYTEKWEDAQLEDLETLCKACHQKEHNITPGLPHWVKTWDDLKNARAKNIISREIFVKFRSKFFPYAKFKVGKKARKRIRKWSKVRKAKRQIWAYKVSNGHWSF